MGTELLELPRGRAALVLAADAHGGLQDFSGDDGSPDLRAGRAAVWLQRLPAQAVRDVRALGILCPVPGDGFQLPEPASRTGGHLLLFRARRIQAYDGSGRRSEPAHDPARLRAGAVFRSR